MQELDEGEVTWFLQVLDMVNSVGNSTMMMMGDGEGGGQVLITFIYFSGKF